MDYWECGDTVAQPTVGQADLSYGLDRGFTFLGWFLEYICSLAGFKTLRSDGWTQNQTF